MPLLSKFYLIGWLFATSSLSSGNRNSVLPALLRKLKIKLLAVQVVLNLLDDITTEALRCKMEYSDSQTQVRNIISVEGIESRVEEITDTLEFLAQQKDALGLKEGVGEKLSNRWPTTSFVDESGVYGRDGNKEEIVEFLLSSNASEN